MPTLAYPEGLGTNPDLLHFVVFYINVHEGSTQFLPGTGGAGVGVGAGGGVAAAIGGSTLTRSTGSARTVAMQRLDTIIALHVAEPPQNSHRALYNNVDLGAIGHASEWVSQRNNATDLLAPTMARMASSVTSARLDNIASVSTRMRLNPFRQQYFEEMDYRTFRFTYKFLPRSVTEGEAVRQIVENLRFHMHPERSSNGGFLIYPSEFDIAYFYNGVENLYWHRINTCVLVDLQVAYGGDKFSSFIDGKPTEVNLSLVFKEISPITKENFTQGRA